ncbi:helix-turn-helix domain-containing protein [Xanthomonas arboricola]|uniref:helix-turn-helix domain-containing protein n=1 Tax=Xanthomonas arboricola TaxID=56448 RepID=UPI003CCE9B4F
MDRPSKTLVAEAGSHLGVDVVTVYRWLKRWRREGSISALAPQPSNGGRGKSRLRPEVEAVLAQSIQELFLTQQRLKPSRLMQDVRMRCLIRPGFRRHSRPSLRVAPFKLYRGQVAS